MRKNNLSLLLLIFLGILFVNYNLYKNYKEFINSNYFLTVVTFCVGGIAIFLYLKQRIDNKSNAAKIILQEVRRAEEIILSYQEHRHFRFTQKIIATDSWSQNIHHFVGELNQDELDKISNLYSTGAYLDGVIKKISNIKFDSIIFENFLAKAKEHIDGQIDKLKECGVVLNSAQVIHDDKDEKNVLKVHFTHDVINIDSLFMEIVSSYQPIYHSNICEKLKKIARID